METEDLIKLPASSNSGDASNTDGPHELDLEAVKSDSLNLNSELQANNEGAGTLSNDDDVDMSISSDEENVDLNSPVLKDLDTRDSVEAVMKMTSVSHVHAENESLSVHQEISFSNHKKDETLVCREETDSSTIHGVKRPRTSFDEEQPSVRVIFSSLPRESKQKLEELLQQWSKWHSQKCSSSFNSDLESGEETYFPALRVGLDNPSAITFWVDSQKKVQSSKDSKPLDGSSVPLYDRGYSLALSSGDASSSLDGVVEKLDTSRCFNCGSYGHALKVCPQPRDSAAVNNARREHRSRRNQNSSSRNFTRTRYYQSTRGGKYDGLTPGVLDVETRRVLGLGELDPPPWLNRMRELGYPPGYLGVDLEDQPSGITIFGEETEREESEQGEEGEILNSTPIQPSKKMTVEFPGINAPIPENADEWLWAPNPLIPNLSSFRSQPWSNHPYENPYRNERRWSRDFDDERPPGWEHGSSPSLSNHFPRYGDYEYGLSKIPNLSSFRSQPWSNHPYENPYRNERRWSRDFDDERPPGWEHGSSPSLSNHFPRYGDYEYGLSPSLSNHFPRYGDYEYGLSPRASPAGSWSSGYNRSLSDRGRRNPTAHDGSSSHGHYGNLPYTSPR